MTILWLILIGMAVVASILLWQKSAPKLSLALALALPLVALGAYWHWGNSLAWANYQRLQALNKHLPAISQLTADLQQRLARNPNSARGWYLLGRLYLDQQRFSEAVPAFAKANALHPQQPDILYSYAQALLLQPQTALRQQALPLLQTLHRLAPQRDDATNLLALALYQQGQYAPAIALWEKLSERYTPDSADGRALLQAIALAQQKEKVTVHSPV